MKLSKVHTACFGCKFAEWDGDTQTGCDYGVVEALQDKDHILEAENEQKKFFIVNDKICLLRRNEGYADDKDPREEVCLNYIYLINHFSEQETLKIIEKLKEEKFRPIHLFIILKKDCVLENHHAFFKALKGFYKWHIKTEVDDRPFEDAVHECLLSMKVPYYITNEDGKWPQKIVGHLSYPTFDGDDPYVRVDVKLSDIVNKLIYSPPFSYIKLPNGYMAQTRFHLMFSNNKITEKCDELWPNKSITL